MRGNFSCNFASRFVLSDKFGHGNCVILFGRGGSYAARSALMTTKKLELIVELLQLALTENGEISNQQVA